MDPRLEEASRNGNLEALQCLLEEDSLLLHQLSATISSLANNPLHIAALLGHDLYAREILRLNPELARDLNAQGLTPLHLASATGCLAVVKELMDVTGSSELCRLRDKDGMLPVHVAAAKGRFQVLPELIKYFPESTRELTCRGETVIHLAVKSGCYEALEFFIERTEGDQESLLNAKDDRGNTILHIATDRRQLRMVKLLLTKPNINVNAKNVRGLNVLDMLLESMDEYIDPTLVNAIVAAGGKRAGKVDNVQSKSSTTEVDVVQLESPTTSLPRTRFQNWTLHLFRAMRWLGLTPTSHRPQFDNETNNSGTLMVVATLIATITFQPIMNPPGGFDSKGNATHAHDLRKFLVFDMVGLFASLSIILLLICVEPRRKRKLMSILVWVMWIAVYFTALAFTSAASIVFPDSTTVTVLLTCWTAIILITFLWVYFRFAIYMFYIVKWWKVTSLERSVDSRSLGVALCIKRALVLAMVVRVPALGLYIANYYYPMVSAPIWSLYLLNPWVLVLEFPQIYLCLQFILYLLRIVGWCNGRERVISQAGLYLVMKRTLMIMLVLLAITFELVQFFWVTVFVWHLYG